MSIETRGSGRTLTVLFTCSRCGAETLLPYDDVMKGEHYGYLRNSELPRGWETIGYSFRLFCPKCVEGFNAFMKAGKQNGDESVDY